MGKVNKEYNLMVYLKKFILESRSGTRLQKNGKRLSASTIHKYEFLYLYLYRFCQKKKYKLRIKSINRLSTAQLMKEKIYWKKFYLDFTDYLYSDLNHFDNYVTTLIKVLRAFFNYLNQEKGLDIGAFHKYFYVRNEDIPVIVISPERLNFLIYSKTFEQTLPPKLKTVKDIFVFGCTVALRVSDLFNLNPHNLEYINDRVYLKVRSTKTQRYTSIKLPKYAIEIINKYKGDKQRVFPPISMNDFNVSIKKLAELADWTEIYEWQREKRGVMQYIYKNPVKKTHYRFCDTLSSHTMRRTAITTMLILGMPEQIVRKISGHAAHSKEFYKYVNYAQCYIDTEIDDVHLALEQKKLL